MIALLIMERRKKYTNISAADLADFLAANKELNVQLLDVRTSLEFNKGALPNARHFDIKQADFVEDIAELDKDATYLVYCKMGVRSVSACIYMHSLGFKNLYNLKEGIMGVGR